MGGTPRLEKGKKSVTSNQTGGKKNMHKMFEPLDVGNIDQYVIQGGGGQTTQMFHGQSQDTMSRNNQESVYTQNSKISVNEALKMFM